MKNTNKVKKATNQTITSESAFSKLLSKHMDWMQNKSSGVQGYIENQDVSGYIIADRCFDCMVMLNCDFTNTTFVRCSFDGTEFDNCKTEGIVVINCNCSDSIPGHPDNKNESNFDDSEFGIVVAQG